jgi:hypothetical protein
MKSQGRCPVDVEIAEQMGPQSRCHPRQFSAGMVLVVPTPTCARRRMRAAARLLLARSAASARADVKCAFHTSGRSTVAPAAQRQLSSEAPLRTTVSGHTTGQSDHLRLEAAIAGGAASGRRTIRLLYSSFSTYCGYVSFADLTTILSPLSFASMFRDTTLYLRSV